MANEPNGAEIKTKSCYEVGDTVIVDGGFTEENLLYYKIVAYITDTGNEKYYRASKKNSRGVEHEFTIVQSEIRRLFEGLTKEDLRKEFFEGEDIMPNMFGAYVSWLEDQLIETTNKEVLR